MQKSLSYVIDTFYSKDKYNTILYIITNILTTPLFFMEIFLTKFVIDKIQNANEIFFYDNTLRMIVFLIIILYLTGINSSLKAITTTKLTEISLYEKERLILEKASKLLLIDLESPDIKTLREKSNRLSLFDLMAQWIECFVNSVTVIALMLLLIYYKCLVLVLVSILILLFQLMMNKRIAQKIEEIYQKQASSNRVVKYLFNLLVNRETIQEVRIYKMCNYLKSKMKNIFTRNFKEVERKFVVFETNKFFNNIVIALMKGLSITFLVVILGRDNDGTGLFVMLFQVTTQLFVLLPKLTTGYSNLKTSRMRYTQFIKYLNIEEGKTSSNELKVKDKGMKIVVNDLDFRYRDNETDTLKNVNLVINPGEKVAFVGENGSGKSTLAKIILGLYKPSKGEIKWFNGNEEILLSEVANRARVVFQDFTRLFRPIRENIAIGNINELKNDSVLQSALEKSEAYKFVQNLDDLVGPEFGGIDLSGGQWQKLAISRAYLTQKLLTIFDEPTAALDPEAELDAFRSFVKLSDNKTSIIVTHRLYMAKFVDKIFVISDGKIVECGTHDELIALKGKYQKMFKLQSSLYI
jgi:ABC-type multidrug transport system fused ATPase/permease subunit